MMNYMVISGLYVVPVLRISLDLFFSYCLTWNFITPHILYVTLSDSILQEQNGITKMGLLRARMCSRTGNAHTQVRCGMVEDYLLVHISPHLYMPIGQQVRGQRTDDKPIIVISDRSISSTVFASGSWDPSVQPPFKYESHSIPWFALPFKCLGILEF